MDDARDRRAREVAVTRRGSRDSADREQDYEPGAREGRGQREGEGKVRTKTRSDAEGVITGRRSTEEQEEEQKQWSELEGKPGACSRR